MFNEIPETCRYGYIKVNSNCQEDNLYLETQKNEFLKLGIPVKNIRLEVCSMDDKVLHRPVFDHLINNELKEGDLLIIPKWNQCCFDLVNFAWLKKQLNKKGVFFRSLDIPEWIDIDII